MQDGRTDRKESSPSFDAVDNVVTPGGDIDESDAGLLADEGIGGFFEREFSPPLRPVNPIGSEPSLSPRSGNPLESELLPPPCPANSLFEGALQESSVTLPFISAPLQVGGGKRVHFWGGTRPGVIDEADNPNKYDVVSALFTYEADDESEDESEGVTEDEGGSDDELSGEPGAKS